MGQRERAPEIQALYDKGAKVYSYSKLSTIHDCPYNAYLTYIDQRPTLDNVYSYMGTICHDTLEGIIEGKNTVADISPAIENGLEELKLLGMEFPKTRDGGDGIKDRWTANMRCMARDYVSPKGEFDIEKLLILKIREDRYLQGYADLIRKLPDGRVQVLDIKTSSQFQDKDLLHYGRQLVAYTMALEQAGYTCALPAWIMIKYVQVHYMAKRTLRSKTEEEFVKVCDRCKLGNTINRVVRNKMKDAGYSAEEIDETLERFCESNDMRDLPADIASQFKVTTYVRPYKVTDELRKECLNYINETADKFEEMQKTGDWPHKEVTDDKGNPDFFCSNLCGHHKDCEYLRDAINKSTFYKAKEADLDDLF